MTGPTRLSDLLRARFDMPPAVTSLVVGTAFLAFATSFLWPLNTIYVYDVLGRSLTEAGLVLLLQAGMATLANLAGGHLHDRWGGRPTIVLGALVASAAALGIAFADSFPAYVALMAGLGTGSGLIYPALNALAGAVWQGGGRRPFNALYVARNVGVAFGASTGGLVAGLDFRAVFAVNAGLGLLFSLYVWRAFPRPGRGAETVAASRAPATSEPRKRSRWHGVHGSPALSPWRDTPLVLLALGLFLATAAYSQWTTTVATHMQSLGIAIPQYSLLWTINGAVIILGQPLVAWFTRRVPDVSRQIHVGTAIYLGVFLLLLAARPYWSFVVLMVFLTLGEMLVWPAVPAAADLLADEGRRGAYQGLVSGGTSLGRMLGPVAGGIVYDAVAPRAVFAVFAAVLAAALAVFAAAARHGRARASEGRSGAAWST